MKYSISIVLPIYNEEESITTTIKKLVPALKGGFSDYEIIIVESGSTDNSGNIADKITKKNKKIRVVHQGKRMGYGNAIRRGIRDCKLDLWMYMDADLPYDFKYIVEASKYMKNYDAVVGNRIGKRESLGRLILSNGSNFLVKIFFRIKVKDRNLTFKMVKTDLLKKFNFVSNYDFIPVEILLELKRFRAKIKQIDVPYQLRKKGQSKVNYIKSVREYLYDAFNYLKKNHKI